MNIRVQAKTMCLTAKTVMHKIIIKIQRDSTPTINSYYNFSLPLFKKVVSIAGHSISAINPKFLRGERIAVCV
jgi:hypothetical protein